MTLKNKVSQKILFLFAALPITVAVLSCKQDSFSLYEGISTDVISITASSHNQADYQPAPDSLQLQFNKILRLLQVRVVTSGCEPEPEAKVEATENRIHIYFGMNNSCEHVVAENFDVEISVSPVHPDVFLLLVEERSFESENTPGRILLSRQVDVRELPGM